MVRERTIERLPLPATLSAVLSIKIGEPLANSRSVAGTHELEVQVMDGYDVLAIRTSRLVAQTAESFKISNESRRDKPTLMTDTLNIYLKPANGRNQTQYVRLEADTFMSSITSAWNNSFSRGARQADFRLELFVYCTRKSNNTQTTVRATAARIDEARAHVSSVFYIDQLSICLCTMTRTS